MKTPDDQLNENAQPGAAQSTGTRLLSGPVGVAIVLACLIVPLILGVLSVTTEQAAADKAVQELQAASTPPAATATTSDRPRLLDEQYYFVNGCVSAPVDCGKANGGTWGEYYTELGRLYSEAAAEVAGEEQVQPFDEWAKTHVHFLSGQTGAAGAYELEQSLPQNPSQADIHLIGTSAGGAAIFFYMSQMLRGDIPFDKRIRSGIAIDSPLGFQFPFRASDLVLGIQAGAMKSSVELGIGEWAKAANISLFAVDTPNDIVNHEAVPDVPEDTAPVYPPENAPPTPDPSSFVDKVTKGGPWHVYTGSHMAESTKKFMEEHWR